MNESRATGLSLRFSSDHPRSRTARELTIGRKLREIREQRQLTQQEMASKAGVPRTYISRIENARLLPGPVMLRRIADALAVEILELLPQNRHAADCENSFDEKDPFWSALSESFSQLHPEQMSLVLDQARSMMDHPDADLVPEPALVAD